MAANKTIKFKKYRKPFMNIGMIIFSVIFVYVIICVVISFQTTHIVRYEVKEGSLTVNNVYRGIALRKEVVYTSPTPGYINYYAKEGDRIGKNGLVYLVDETGRLYETIDALNQGENTLTNEELKDFKTEIVDFTHIFNQYEFDKTYDCKKKLNNAVLKLSNTKMLNSLNTLNKSNGINIINYSYAPQTGIVSYWTDGMEYLTPSQITEEYFNEDNHEKKYIMTNSMIEQGENAYKLVTSEKWSIVIPVENERGAVLEDIGYLKVRFLKNQYESWAETRLWHNDDQKAYLELKFNNSMITFANDRYLDIELIVEEETGLKIPVSSIVQKEFFIIPEDFVTISTNSGIANLMRQCYLEDGTISSELLDAEIYWYDSETKEYYFDSSILNVGDLLIKLDSQDIYTVSKRATLIGVYNMNKGYADFKQISILYQNDEYAIIRSNTKYGLNVYDYIVLDASAVKDDQFIK